MSERRALRRLLLDDEGRASRRVFWLYGLGAIAFVMSALALLPQIGVPARMTPLIASLALIYPSYCVIAKRLQDAGIEGHWAIAVSGVAAIDALFVAAGPAEALTAATALARALWWWVSLANMAAFIAIGLLPGDRGPNRFGPRRI